MVAAVIHLQDKANTGVHVPDSTMETTVKKVDLDNIIILLIFIITTIQCSCVFL